MTMTLQDHLIALWQRVAEMERRQANMIRHAPITDVDTKKQLLRVRLNPESEKEVFKSAWIPYGQMAAPDTDEVKGYKFHNPPTKGQNVTLFSPGGDPAQSIALPFTWSEKAPSPSDKPDEHVITMGKFKMTIKKDTATIQMGDKTKITWTEDELTFEGPKGQFKMDNLHLEEGANHKVTGDTGAIVRRSAKVFIKTAQPANPTELDTAP